MDRYYPVTPDPTLDELRIDTPVLFGTGLPLFGADLHGRITGVSYGPHSGQRIYSVARVHVAGDGERIEMGSVVLVPREHLVVDLDAAHADALDFTAAPLSVRTVVINVSNPAAFGAEWEHEGILWQLVNSRGTGELLLGVKRYHEDKWQIIRVSSYAAARFLPDIPTKYTTFLAGVRRFIDGIEYA